MRSSTRVCEWRKFQSGYTCVHAERITDGVLSIHSWFLNFPNFAVIFHSALVTHGSGLASSVRQRDGHEDMRFVADDAGDVSLTRGIVGQHDIARIKCFCHPRTRLNFP